MQRRIEYSPRERKNLAGIWDYIEKELCNQVTLGGSGPGNWDGQYSIRINDQYPICFCFEDGEASRVELVDYH